MPFLTLVLQATSTSVMHKTAYPRDVVTQKSILLYVPIITSGGSTGLNAEGIAGRVLLILTEVIFLIVWLSLVAGCAYLCCRDYGKRLPLYSVVCIYCSGITESFELVQKPYSLFVYANPFSKE